MSPEMRLRGTTMCTPLLASTRRPPSAPASDSVCSVHTPVALMTARARTSMCSPVSRSTHLGAGDRAAGGGLQVDHLGAGRGVGAVADGGADEGLDQARVVDAGVPVADRADRGVVPQVGEQPLHALAGQVPVDRQRAPRAGDGGQRVVQRDAGADVGPLPDAVLDRVEEAHGLDQVRRQAVDEEVALGERLAHQVEVEHLQVAQPAVHQLAGPARRAARPVLGLDDRRGQAAAHRVEGDPRAGDAAPDHEDVELVATFGAPPHGVESVLSCLGRQRRSPHPCNPRWFCGDARPGRPARACSLSSSEGERTRNRTAHTCSIGCGQRRGDRMYIEREQDVLRAASMYYLQDIKMEVIARHLGTSRSTVSRLIKRARQSGLVEITLRPASTRAPGLGRTIARRVRHRHLRRPGPGLRQPHRAARPGRRSPRPGCCRRGSTPTWCSASRGGPRWRRCPGTWPPSRPAAPRWSSSTAPRTCAPAGSSTPAT